MDEIRARYRVACPASEQEHWTRYLAVETTVECPEELIDASIERDRVGRIEAIERRNDESEITVAFPAGAAAGQLPQLLNLVYGIVAMQPHIRLVDLDLPASLLDRFPGPRHSLEGIRNALEVFDRPLLCTALKPRGAPLERLARIAREFVLGGGDIVKDDHNLVDQSEARFKERVARCQEAVCKASAATGRPALYLPNVYAPKDRLESRCKTLAQLGIEGMMIAPLIFGLDTARDCAQNHDLMIAFHPSLAGAYVCHKDHGIAPEVLFGTLFRLAGADISIFTSFSGRYKTEKQDCKAIADRLREPLGNLPATLPAPAGGMHAALFDEMTALYGTDTLFIVAGALLREKDIASATRRHLEIIRRAAR